MRPKDDDVLLAPGDRPTIPLKYTDDKGPIGTIIPPYAKISLLQKVPDLGWLRAGIEVCKIDPAIRRDVIGSDRQEVGGSGTSVCDRPHGTIAEQGVRDLAELDTLAQFSDFLASRFVSSE